MNTKEDANICENYYYYCRLFLNPMKVPTHIVGLYNKSVRRYKKLTSRLKKQKHTTGYGYHVLLHQLKKLEKKIAGLQFQLKIATATGAVVLALQLTPAQAQTTHGPFSLQPRHLNPLREPYKFDGTTYPTKVDLDKDGDYDLVVGDNGNYYYSYYGTNYIKPLRYFLNIGTKTNPVFEEKKGSDNPFNDLQIAHQDRGPVFADIDQDGDEDLFVGIKDFNNPQVLYFRNDAGVFVEQTTAWDPVTKEGNPFLGIGVKQNIKLCFVDLDKDGDLDAIIGGVSYDDYSGAVRHISYYKNDGNGSFSDATNEMSITPAPMNYDLNPAVADLDKDGDADLVLGGYYLGLKYYKQVSPGNFVEETGPWDASTQTGNPFDEIYQPNTQPLFVDLNNDSNLELLLGDGDGDYSYRYPNTIIHYFDQTGNNVFVEKPDLANPLGGIDVGFNASPVLIDLDGDHDLDALIGNKYDNYYYSYGSPQYYNQDAGTFERKSDEENPFESMEVVGSFMPVVVDLDGDGDLDVISGDYYGQVHFFRNNAGEYTEEIVSNPFETINVGNRTSPKLADLDGDQDLDLILSNRYEVHYFENTGTAQNPQFEERLDTENPFLTVGTTNYYSGFLNLADIDHDGDLDLLAAEYSYTKYYSGSYKIFYYENTGTPTAPVFELSQDQPFVTLEIPSDSYAPYNLQPFTIDQDQDGDLDLFIGDDFGYVSFVKNDNPTVVATITAAEINYKVGTDEVVLIDPEITLADADNDVVIQATVTISNFKAGDELSFTPQSNISGVFNNSTGILTFKGKATLAEYESLLRTVSYRYAVVAGGRKRSQGTVEVKSLEFRIYDTDFTNPTSTEKTLNVNFNSPPAFANATETTHIGNRVTIDLKLLISDPDNNINPSSLRIVQQPSSGAVAEIDQNQNLILDYDGVNFVGTDKLTIEVCDDLGVCAQNLITIQVENLSSEIEVFNAVAPNSSGDNRFMRIHNLPQGNKVSVYSRWGNKVFEVLNYDNAVPGKRFEGLNNNGKALPSGTYFYKIEIPDGSNLNGPELLTGYISLKQ